MAAPPSPNPPVLTDELVEECLLRVPPEEPAGLARAALVSKQWHRVVTGAGFRRRYMEFHRSPPLLGYMVNFRSEARFVSTSSSFRPPHADRSDVEAIHASHGRILLRSTRDKQCEHPVLLPHLHFFLWDPIRDKQWELPVLLSSPDPYISAWDAAVVCAVGDGCSHLDCHFGVVVVGRSGGRTFSCFYSSEEDSWSGRNFVSVEGFCFSKLGSVLVANSLYFRRGGNRLGAMIIKYDLVTHQVYPMSLRCGCELGIFGQPIATEDGRLGVATASKSTLCLWLKEQERLVRSRVIQLHDLLSDDALRDPLASDEEPLVVGFAETGAGVIFLSTRVGYFTVDLRSGKSQKVGNALGSGYIVPCVSFWTPAPGTIHTDEGPGASAVVSTDDEPGAVVGSRDEGLGDVAVSTDDMLGPSMSSA